MTARWYRLAIGAVLLGQALVLVWNAWQFDWLRGYDAYANDLYARIVSSEQRLPSESETGAWHTPPLWFALAGALRRLASELGAAQIQRPGQLLAAAAGLATCVIVMLIARELWPGRRALHFVALLLAASSPALVRASAMYHPETLAVALATTGSLVAVRGFRTRPTVRTGLAVGALLGLAALTRAWALPVLVALVAVFLAESVRSRRWAPTISLVAASLVLVGPWLVNQQLAHGDALAFNRPAPAGALIERRPASFYLGPRLIRVFDHPITPLFRNELVPHLYADWWGDWALTWDSPPVPTHAQLLPPHVVAERARQSIAGLLPTLLALAGVVALAIVAIRERSPALAVLPLGAFAVALAYLLFAIRFPSTDGDTIKATYLLMALPAAAVGAAFVVDTLRPRGRTWDVALAVALVVLVVVQLPFLVLCSTLWTVRVRLYSRAMHAPGSRSNIGRAVVICVIAAIALLAVRNATVYPAIAGYDAVEAIEYARGLVEDGRLPEGTGSYYTPPGFFAVGGVGIEIGDALGLDHPERVGQLVNALAVVGTALLLLALVRLLWPGRPVLHIAAVVFFAVCPVAMKSAAMFHPEPLSMVLSTAAVVAAARLLVRSDYRLHTAALLGVILGLAQLVRAWTLWTVGAVLLVLLVATVTRAADRGSLLRSTAVVAALAILVPAPWYAHQLDRYDSAVFGQPHPDEPVWSRRPLAFFVGNGLPDVVSEPYRPSFSREFLPIAYAETWGDYFGVWRWFPSREPPSDSDRRQLVAMSIVGLPFTLVAVAGWLALLGLCVRRPGRSTERLLVALLPLAALVGVLYFATAYPTPDGDTVKGSFMLTAVPAWAACFGFAFDGLRTRFRRFSVVFLATLAVLGLAAVPFLLAVPEL